MKPQIAITLRYIAFTLLWLALTYGLIFIMLDVPDNQIAAPASTRNTKCATSDIYLWNGLEDRIVTHDGSPITVTLAGNSTIYQQVCQPGTLRMFVRGTPAEGIDAQLVVSLNTTNLLTMGVTAERPLEIRVDQSGLLAITFGNDRYLPDLDPPEDRNVFIRELKFTPDP